MSKYTSFPPNEIHRIVRNNKTFELPSEQGKDLYIQLRMLEVVLSIRPVIAESSAKRTIKKAAAKAKTTAVNQKDLSGLEQLKENEGIIVK